MPTAVVTGATGFIGQHLTAQLVDAGWSVRVLRRKSSDLGVLADLDVKHLIGDVTDADSVMAAINTGDGVDAVFHVAANTSTWSGDAEWQTKVNVDGTRNVVEACKAAGVERLVHTSSIAVWGFAGEAINEETPRDTSALWINYYCSKVAAEDFVKQAVEEGLNAVIVNPAHVMGPWDKQNWIRMIRMVNANKLPGIPPGAGSFSDVREVAKAHIMACLRGKTGENYLLGGDNQTYFTLVQTIARMLDVPLNIRKMPPWLLKIVAKIKSMLAGKNDKPDITPEEAAIVSGHETVDSGKAIRELGYAITPLNELLADTIGWMKEEEML